jgi:DNA-directed RNA polymerase specialized sigma24 family protein
VRIVDEKTLLLLAKRARDKFRGNYPQGVTPADCLNDCVVRLLELNAEKGRRVPEGVSVEAWLVTRCHGDVRDYYGRLWKKQSHIRTVNAPEGIDPTDPPDPDVVDDVRGALHVLNELELKVMTAFLDGQTQSQIAESIGSGQPYVSHVLARARQKMAPLLEAYRV